MDSNTTAESNPLGVGADNVELGLRASAYAPGKGTSLKFHKKCERNSCCFETCACCNSCRNFPTMSPEEVVENARIGDIFLFENNSCAAGCIQCWTRSDFDHVGMVIWTTSRCKARNADGERFEIEYEGPHLLEALTPVVICDPLETVMQQVLKSGGKLYWRQLQRPQLEGEPLGPNGRPMPPPIIKRNIGDPRLPLSRDYFPQEKKSISFDFKREKKWVYNMLDPKSAEYKACREKCKDVHIVSEKMPESTKRSGWHEDAECIRLKENLNFVEWNQHAVDFITNSYEKKSSTIIDAAMNQDAGFWATCFPCCCGNDQGVDGRTLEEKMQSEESVFCSELVALMYYKAGWRLGSMVSDAYLPKDFGDAINEHLTADFPDTVKLGPVIQVACPEKWKK